jgi:hypothetical protein
MSMKFSFIYPLWGSDAKRKKVRAAGGHRYDDRCPTHDLRHPCDAGEGFLSFTGCQKCLNHYKTVSSLRLLLGFTNGLIVVVCIFYKKNRFMWEGCAPGVGRNLNLQTENPRGLGEDKALLIFHILFFFCKGTH